MKEAFEYKNIEGKGKIKLSTVFRTILWQMLHKNKISQRELMAVGRSPTAHTATGMPENVTHPTVGAIYKSTDAGKLKQIFLQLHKGIKEVAKSHKSLYQKVRIFDSTVMTNGHSEFPFTKLSVSILPQSFIANNYLLSHSHADKEPFEYLVDWDSGGYTYIFDRGLIEVDYYKRIIASGNNFVTRKYSQHHFDWKYNVPIRQTMVKHFKVLRKAEAIIGSKEKVRVKAVYVENLHPKLQSKDEPNKYWIISSRLDLSAKEIVELWSLRWQVETYFNWMKNTFQVRGSDWKQVQSLEVFIALFLIALTFWCIWGWRYFGANWSIPEKFSMYELLREARAVVHKFWEYRTFYPTGKKRL